MMLVEEELRDCNVVGDVGERAAVSIDGWNVVCHFDASKSSVCRAGSQSSPSVEVVGKAGRTDRIRGLRSVVGEGRY